MRNVIHCRARLEIDENKLARELNDKFIYKSDPIPVRIIKRIMIKQIVRSLRVVAHKSDGGIQLEVKCDMPRDDNKILP